MCNIGILFRKVVIRRLDHHMPLILTLTQRLKRCAIDDFRDLTAEQLENMTHGDNTTRLFTLKTALNNQSELAEKIPPLLIGCVIE